MNIGISSVRTKSSRLDRWELIKELQKNDGEIYYIGRDSNEEIHDDYSKYGVKYLPVSLKRVNTNPLKELSTLIDYWKTFKRNKIDYLLVYGIRTFPAVMLAARLAGVKNIVGIVNGSGRLFKLKGFKGSILKLVSYPMLFLSFYVSNHIFIQNKDDLNLLKKKKLLARKNYSIINGSGVNLDEYPQVPLNKKPIFTYIGRITAAKGVNELIESAIRLNKVYPEAKTYLVGPIDDNKLLNQEMLDLAIKKKIVEVVGNVSDVRPYIKNTRFFVLPSYYGEGVPRTILEAMSMGRPILTTDSPGCRETVKNGFNGFKVPIKNVDKLTEKMIWMIENENQVEEMGSNSRILCEEKFNVHDINRKTLSKLLI